MKRKLLLTTNIIGIVLVLFVIVAGKMSHSAFLNGISESIHETSAISIIGGADGPTTIFVSGSFDLNTVALLLLVSLLLVVVILILNVVYLKNKKNS